LLVARAVRGGGEDKSKCPRRRDHRARHPGWLAGRRFCASVQLIPVCDGGHLPARTFGQTFSERRAVRVNIRLEFGDAIARYYALPTIGHPCRSRPAPAYRRVRRRPVPLLLGW